MDAGEVILVPHCTYIKVSTKCMGEYPGNQPRYKLDLVGAQEVYGPQRQVRAGDYNFFNGKGI